MKKLQNSLYINTQKTFLHKERETLVVEQARKKLLQIPIHSVKNVFCFGNVLVSPAVMGFCGERGVGLAFFSEYGKYQGRLQGRQTGNVLLRKAQYLASQEMRAGIVRSIVAAKIRNCRAVLHRRLRNHGGNLVVEEAVTSLARCVTQVGITSDIDRIRGYEGEAAATYFSAFSELLRPQVAAGFRFERRARRPPTDPLNALLSFCYSILGNEISSALQGVGLDPQCGFLHMERSGRDSLAQDILEEFRAWWVDRFVLSLVNRGQLGVNDFIQQESGAVILKDDARRKLLVAWQERKQGEILHPYLNEKTPIGLLPHLQSMLLARHIRGDIAQYPPFVMN